MQRTYMRDARKQGIKVLPPNINESSSDFSISRTNDIIYGFSGIKGVGATSITQVINLRPFKSFGDFLLRSHLLGTRINKKTIDALVSCGACDCFGYKRSLMMRNYEKYILDFDPKGLYKKTCTKEKEIPEDILNLMKEHLKLESSYFIDHKFKEFGIMDIIEMEKETIGISISGDPFAVVAKGISDELSEMEEVEQTVREYGGQVPGYSICVVNKIKPIKMKNGGTMAFLDIEDHEGRNYSITLFGGQYTKYQDILGEGKFYKVAFSAKPSYKDPNAIDYIVNALMDLSYKLEDAANNDEHKAKANQVLLFFEEIPTLVRCKTIASKIEEAEGSMNDQNAGMLYVMLSIDESKYEGGSSSKFDVKFGPYITKELGIDQIRNLNKIPGVSVGTR